MSRTKQLNAVVVYLDNDSNHDFVISDKGADKSPRFELYNKATKTTLAKSNNPKDFDEYMKKKVWLIND